MLLIILLVFVAVFAIAALLLWAGSSSPNKQFQKALDSAIKVPNPAMDEVLVDVRKSTVLSSIPWLNRMLADLHPVLQLQRMLDQAGLRWTPSRLLLTAAVAWAVPAYVLYLRTGMGLVSALIALATGAIPFYYVSRKRKKRFNVFLKKLPDVLDLMVSALRAGFSTVAAFGHAANEAPEPIGREFRLCFEEQNFGVDLRFAAQHLIQRVPLQELRIVSTAMLINKESGGNLAEVLEKTSYVIRERFRLQQQIRIHTAQGRLTGQILSILPFALGLILYMLNPDYMQILVTKPVGQKMIGLAVTMNIVGMLIIRKIVNIRI